MGDLAAWLSAIHKTCVELLAPLDDDYGVETVQDLLNLEPEDIDKLVDKLKRSPGKNFRAAISALAIDADLPSDAAAGAGPKSIPEAVPPDKPVDLHTVGTLSPTDEDEDGSGPFFSLRFGAEHRVVPMAKELQGALTQRGAPPKIIDMMAGGDIDAAVQRGIEASDTFVIFGSAKYGENTGNMACTYYESKFAWDRKKRIILIRMIPFDQEFEFEQARFLFGLNMLVIPWLIGTPMPADLPDQILRAMGQGPRAAAAPADATPDLEPEDETATAAMEAALAAERAQLQAQQAQAAAAQSEQKAALEAQAAQMKAQME
eukprot:COSAG01_NODE_13854_length_1526_cov_5.946741_1_plen_317_part_01